MKAYYDYFKVIEVQRTFYKLPKLETLNRWRNEAPEDFEFCLKAWQVITHPPSSPTWRKAGLKVREEEREGYGYFKPSEVNLRAWELVKETCKALRAKLCIFQTPPSFNYTEDNVRNVLAFFKVIRRDDLLLAWEPRGDWYEHGRELRNILKEANLIHVVDPLRREPLYLGEICYFRLHGLGGREVNYKYKYTEGDLIKLLNFLEELSCRVAYVLFNNVYMFEDALRFKHLASESGLEVL